MKIRILSLLTVMLLVALFATPVAAGPGIGLKDVQFSLGSLIANGTLTGLGKQDVTVILQASGIPVITCTNNGSNDVPGQSYPKITAVGKQSLLGNDPIRKNGKSPFYVETTDTVVSWDAAGCPNSNWTARVDFVFWTNATLSVYDSLTNTLQLERKFVCTTTRYPASVSCTPVP